jgi:hypothetical protein
LAINLERHPAAGSRMGILRFKLRHQHVVTGRDGLIRPYRV